MGIQQHISPLLNIFHLSKLGIYPMISTTGNSKSNFYINLSKNLQKMEPNKKFSINHKSLNKYLIDTKYIRQKNYNSNNSGDIRYIDIHCSHRKHHNIQYYNFKCIFHSLIYIRLYIHYIGLMIGKSSIQQSNSCILIS